MTREEALRRILDVQWVDERARLECILAKAEAERVAAVKNEEVARNELALHLTRRFK